MKIDKNQVYHGKVVLLSDNGEKLLIGRGTYISKKNTLYATFRNIRISKIYENYRVIFAPDNNNEVFVSIGKYHEIMVGGFSSNEMKYVFDEFLIAKNYYNAQKIILDGINEIVICIDGIHSRQKTILEDKQISTFNFGEAGRELGIIEDKKFSIFFSTAFSSNMTEVKNYLEIKYSFKEKIPLENYRLLVESLELYWQLFLKETNFNIHSISVGRINGTRKVLSGVIFQETAFTQNSKGRKLIIDQHPINKVILCKILKKYLDGHNNKIVYGFSKYMELHRLKIVDMQVAILYLAAALDSISADIARKKMSKKDKLTFVNNIEKVQKLISEANLDILDEVKSFYCGSKPNDIKEAVCRRRMKDNLKETLKKLKIDDSGDMFKAACSIIKARNSIIHGQSYDIIKISKDKRDKKVIFREEKPGQKQYIFGYERGEIGQCMDLITMIGKKYFCA